MAKMVGLSLVVKQGWMRKAVALLDENLPEAEYRKQLEEHLSYEIDSPTNRRKAREILMKIWYLNSKGVQTLQEEGRKLIQKYPDQLTEIVYSWISVGLWEKCSSSRIPLLPRRFARKHLMNMANVERSIIRPQKLYQR